jgi:hypothetical protein
MTNAVEVPSVTCGHGLHMQAPEHTEPVFHFTEPEGFHGIAHLGIAKGWARELDGGTPLSEMFAQLYVLLPGGRDLIHCALVVVDGERGREMEIEALRPTALESSTLFTCPI